MKRSVAVIGGGIFGCEISLCLKSHGFDVTLIEKNSKIMMGTSRNNSRRIHMGFHYPRHLATAKQSLRGFKSFLDKYQDFLLHSFANYYAVAKDSRTSVDNYESFLESLDAPFKKCSIDEIDIEGLRLEKISEIYKVNELVVDIDSLASHFNLSLKSSGVNVQLSKEVTMLNQINGKWELYFEGDVSLFDEVIIATHGQERFPITSLYSPISHARKIEFHITQILVAQIPDIVKTGITIVDGDFLTLLPVNLSGTYSIYSPSASRIAVETATSNPFHDTLIADLTKSSNTIKLERAFFEWFRPHISIQPIESWFALRSVPAASESTDQRISSVEHLYPNLIKVYSTKIDHCIEIANQISEVLMH